MYYCLSTTSNASGKGETYNEEVPCNLSWSTEMHAAGQCMGNNMMCICFAQQKLDGQQDQAHF